MIVKNKVRPPLPTRMLSYTKTHAVFTLVVLCLLVSSMATAFYAFRTPSPEPTKQAELTPRQPSKTTETQRGDTVAPPSDAADTNATAQNPSTNPARTPSTSRPAPSPAAPQNQTTPGGQTSTPPPTTTPPGPTQSPATNLYATNVGMRTITLNFSPGADSDGIAYYKVMSVNNYAVGTTTTTSLVDDWVFPGMTYSYVVYVVDKLGNVNPGSAPLYVATLSDTEPPTTPTNFHMFGQDSTKAYFTWTDSTDNSATPNIDLEYEIYVTPEPNFKWTSGTHATVYTDPGVTYTITLRATDFPGNFSGYAGPLTFTDLP